MPNLGFVQVTPWEGDFSGGGRPYLRPAVAPRPGVGPGRAANQNWFMGIPEGRTSKTAWGEFAFGAVIGVYELVEHPEYWYVPTGVVRPDRYTFFTMVSECAGGPLDGWYASTGSGAYPACHNIASGFQFTDFASAAAVTSVGEWVIANFNHAAGQNDPRYWYVRDAAGVPELLPPAAYPAPRPYVRPRYEPGVLPRYVTDREPWVRVDPEGRPDDAPYLRPVVETTWPAGRPGGRPKPPVGRPTWHGDYPDKTKKTGTRMPGGMLAALRLFHGATEFADAVNALWAALGPFRDKRARSLPARLADVARNWDRYFTDPGIAQEALNNLVENEVSDRVLGRLFGGRWELGVRSFRSSYASGVVPSHAGDVAFGGYSTSSQSGLNAFNL